MVTTQVVPGAVKSPESKKRYMVIMVGAHLDPGYEEDVHEHAILGINISNNLPDNVTACPNHKEVCQFKIGILCVGTIYNQFF
jgi:hypothetical protein